MAQSIVPKVMPSGDGSEQRGAEKALLAVLSVKLVLALAPIELTPPGGIFSES